MTIEQASALLKLIADFIGNVGLPVALVVVVVGAVFMVGRFLGPIIRAHSEKHLEFVDSVKEANTKQTSILESIAKAIEIQSDAVLKPSKPPRKRGS